MTTDCAGRFCNNCGNWVDSGDRCSCDAGRRKRKRRCNGEDASPAQENAIRWLEDALPTADDPFFDQAV